MRLAGIMMWLAAGLVVSMTGAVVLSLRTSRHSTFGELSLGRKLVAVVTASVLAALGLLLLASVLRVIWVAAGDPSPERIANVYVWDALRCPWTLDSHPRQLPGSVMAGDLPPGFAELRYYGVDPDPPTVFLARKGERWYASRRENAP